MAIARASRTTAALALVAATAAAAGCDYRADELRTARHLPLPVDSVSTLEVDRSGRFWLGRPGQAVALGPDGAVALTVPAGGADVPRLAGEAQGALYLRAGDSLVAVSSATGERSGARDDFGGLPVLPDPLGRFVQQGARSGAVLGFDPVTLAPRWGWAALAARTTALAAAPEGDVVWQAVTDDESGDRILERDVQTGRILIDHPLDAPVRSMAVMAGGDLLVAMGRGPGVAIVRMRSRAGELHRVWRTGVRFEGGGEPRILHAPGARFLGVFDPGSEAGLRVLDAEAGSPVGAVGGTALDAAAAPDGTLYLLAPGGIRRVRLPRD